MKLKFVLLFSLISLLSFSQTAWKISGGTISFKIRNAGITVDGNFATPKGVIEFDEQNYKTSKIEVSTESSSVNTGTKKRDEHLSKSEYFDVLKFPKITITSRFFGKEEKGYMLHATLNLKGVTKNISIPFTYTEQGNTASFNGIFKLNRLDYKVGSKSIILSDDLTIQLIINVTK
jgi:polyisoprenoid-binding protein YceI